MIGLPSSLVAIELGCEIQRAAEEARAWVREYHRLIEIVWEECNARGWPALEMTFPFGKIVPAPFYDEEPDDS